MKGNWTEEEDELLIHLRNVQKIQTWVEISSYFPGRNAKQCSYRYKKTFLGNEKNDWSKEDDLQLMNLVDCYGENFDFLKQYLPNRSVKDLKTRYYGKICHSNYNFSPEEDLVILSLFKSQPVSKESLNMLKNKESSQIKRRLELLLKLRGEDLSSNINISSLISSISTKEDDASSQIFSQTFTNTESINTEILCRVPSERDYQMSNNIINFSDDYSNLKPNIKPSDITTSFRIKNSRFQSNNSFNFKLENKNDENFENTFNGVFNSNSFQNNKEYFMISDQELEFQLRNQFTNNSHLSDLIDKKVALEAMLNKIYSISNLFCNDFETKIWGIEGFDCNKKIEILGIFNNLCKEEKNLIAKFQTEYPNFNQTSEIEFATVLINQVQCLEEMINLVKLKMKLLNSVYSC